MSQNYAWNPNIGAVNGFGNVPPKKAFSVKLAATTNTQVTVPNIVATGNIRNTVPSTGADTGLIYAVFYFPPTAIIWVADGADATPSETTAFVANASVINPSCWLVKGGDVLNFYSDTQVVASVAFYAWQA